MFIVLIPCYRTDGRVVTHMRSGAAQRATSPTSTFVVSFSFTSASTVRGS